MDKILLVLEDHVNVIPTEIETELDGDQRYITGPKRGLEFGEEFFINIFPLEEYTPYYCGTENLLQGEIEKSFLDRVKIIFYISIYFAETGKRIKDKIPHAKLVSGRNHNPPFHKEIILKDWWERREATGISLWKSCREATSDAMLDGVITCGHPNDSSTHAKAFSSPAFSSPPPLTSSYISRFKKEHQEHEDIMKNKIFFSRGCSYFSSGVVDYDKMSTIYPLHIMSNSEEGEKSFSADLHGQYSSDKIVVSHRFPRKIFLKALRSSVLNIHLEISPSWGRAVIESHLLGNPSIYTDCLWGNILYPELNVSPFYNTTAQIIERIDSIKSNRIDIMKDADNRIRSTLAPQARRNAALFIKEVLSE